eukprot:6213924-Pleurochrysis_carterae.AAC.5
MAEPCRAAMRGWLCFPIWRDLTINHCYFQMCSTNDESLRLPDTRAQPLMTRASSFWILP